MPLLPENGVFRPTFPTPAPFPVSGWRPPQYPVPLSYRPDDHFWFIRPIPADTVNWPLSYYRYGNTYLEDKDVHTGIDMGAPTGTPVLAAGPGVVVWVGWGLFGTWPPENDPYGLAIAIRHDFGTLDGRTLYTAYAHLSSTDVWKNQTVKTGDVIGAVGMTGNATGPHLHFEVREDRNAFRTTRNPELWIAPPQGWGVLAGRALTRYGDLLPDQEISIRSVATDERWRIWTYVEEVAVGDDRYQENFAISDLPAGDYEVSLTYQSRRYLTTIPVHAGQVNFLLFQAGRGFTYEPTPTPEPLPTLPNP